MAGQLKQLDRESTLLHYLADELPLALVGGRNLALPNDQHVVLDKRPLRDLYLTLLNQVFGSGIETFGQNLTGAPPASIDQILKA
jgi:hypothetical protein